MYPAKCEIEQNLRNTFFQAKNPHGVQRINKCQTKSEPLAKGLGNGLKLVTTPRMILIAFPSVPEGITYHLQSIHTFTSHYRKWSKKQYLKKKEGFGSKCMFCPSKTPSILVFFITISVQYSVQCVNTSTEIFYGGSRLNITSLNSL